MHGHWGSKRPREKSEEESQPWVKGRVEMKGTGQEDPEETGLFLNVASTE